jgi:hypothetical protein
MSGMSADDDSAVRTKSHILDSIRNQSSAPWKEFPVNSDEHTLTAVKRFLKAQTI